MLESKIPVIVEVPKPSRRCVKSAPQSEALGLDGYSMRWVCDVRFDVCVAYAAFDVLGVLAWLTNIPSGEGTGGFRQTWTGKSCNHPYAGIARIRF